MTQTAIYTMGLPGSGKSTVANQRMDLASMVVVDPDAHKAAHPDYDPKDPQALHAWSNEQAEAQYEAALADGTQDIFVDGTGTNAEKLVRRMQQARAAGYEIEVLYVRVALETAIERNANRERVVPEHVVRSKARDISVAFEIATQHADRVVVVDND